MNSSLVVLHRVIQTGQFYHVAAGWVVPFHNAEMDYQQ
jgi:hypothetical protein